MLPHAKYNKKNFCKYLATIPEALRQLFLIRSISLRLTVTRWPNFLSINSKGGAHKISSLERVENLFNNTAINKKKKNPN
jgi:hypothetical protein